MAARAFCTLCAPVWDQRTSATRRPARMHRKREPSSASQLGGPVAALADGLRRRPAAHGQHLVHGRLAGGMHDQPAARHGAHQMMELALDHGQIIEDVGVIELQVVDDQGARAVVDELGALVEEGRVVLVRLDDEAVALAEPRGHAEVLRHAADQEARRQPGVLQHPGQHAGGRGLAVGAGHRQHVPPRAADARPATAGPET
jgi:hypothetical protein